MADTILRGYHFPVKQQCFDFSCKDLANTANAKTLSNKTPQMI